MSHPMSFQDLNVKLLALNLSTSARCRFDVGLAMDCFVETGPADSARGLWDSHDHNDYAYTQLAPGMERSQHSKAKFVAGTVDCPKKMAARYFICSIRNQRRMS